MPLGIDPKVDFAFKMVFGNPKHTRITIHFLNAVLVLPQPIDWVEILNPIQDKDRSEDKLVVLDVLARDSSGHQFNIEMQTTLPTDLPKTADLLQLSELRSAAGRGITLSRFATGDQHLRARPGAFSPGSGIPPELPASVGPARPGVQR